MDRSIDGASNTIFPTPNVTAPSTYRVLTPHFDDVCTLSFRKENDNIDPSQDNIDEFSKHSRISRATATPNLAHEIFMFQKFGLENKHSILELLTLEQKPWMEVELKLEARHDQGVVPWYSTPCILISQLVWKGKWELYLTEEGNKLKSLGLVGKEYKKKMDEAMKREEEKMRYSGSKYLSIANPAHGEEFFSMLFKKYWNDKSMVGITRDKLYSLCTAKITVERRKELLHMMTSTKLKDSKGGHFTDYKKLRQEAYWQEMYEEAILHIEKLEVEGPKLPRSFEAFFKASRRMHVAQAYSHVLGSIKSASNCASLSEVLLTSKQLVYRWLLDCTRLKTIDSMPVDTEEWLDKEDKHSMFSPLILEKGITSWECSHCPWWLEYTLGIVPKCEQDLQARFQKDSPMLVNTPHKIKKDVPSKSTANLRKDKQASKKSSTILPPHEDEDDEESLPNPPISKEKASLEQHMSRSTISKSVLSQP
ncbi:hypothetical protein L7F22_035806 [Adiantum nelumboides]|nr:hypothetical protein [Adiantum nelumboides]